MYVATGQGRQHQRTKFWCQQKPLVTLVIWYKLKKISFEVLILFIFFFILYMYIAPGQGLTTPWCKQDVLSCYFIQLLQVLKKISMKSWFYTIFFHDLIHVYSPRAGADSRQGTNFLYQQKGLITLTICCKFQRNLFEVWFYTIFIMI